jgi:hypothetical protein
MTKDTSDPVVTALVRVSVAAGVVWTAVSEWQLARIIGAPGWVAPALPIAIDAYVVAAVRAGVGRDLAGSLAIMCGAQIAARLLDAGQVQVSAALVTFVSILVPLIIWRVHALGHRNREPAAVRTFATGSAAEVPQVPPNPASQVPNRIQPPAANPVPPVTGTGSAGSPNPPTKPTPKPPKKAKPKAATNPGTPSALEQVQQILDLIEDRGFDAVKLKTVMDETGMSKTTAYNRLVEARTTWQQEHGTP